ncbi:helix-turn-helix domain-containing protein [Paenibacillus terrigena]|uniref:helix-turn-helix domain-containing protein n=1 Tax=Paenibacillus terrigena TaxID=369333 RepID=UPI0003788B7C|nr:helix-turn-helix domain-containing protein [Paenibacillus terrigena]
MLTRKKEDLPEVMTVADIQKFLGIGKVQAYDLVKSGKFHVVHVGRRIIISRNGFLKWFDGTSEEQAE